MIPVILSGGAGARLWPLSRTSYPKQFLSLSSDKSLFQETLIRSISNNRKSPIIMGNIEHRFLLAEQCRLINVSPESIVLEPCAKNTAAAIAAACLQVKDKNELLLVMPTDHSIRNLDELNKAIMIGERIAEMGRIVTFGVNPVRTEREYGCIQVTEKTSKPQDVIRFVAKPSEKVAQICLKDNLCYWNSGIYLFKISVMLEQLSIYAPEVLDAVSLAMNHAIKDSDFIRLNTAFFEKSPSITIDNAVMEKSSLVSVVPLEAEWNDIGIWSSVWDFLSKDEAGNVTKGDVILHETANSYIHAESRLVSVLGVDDVVIVETADAVMIAAKERSQDIKLLVNQINKTGREEDKVHRQVYRPWGYYDSIDKGIRYQVKKLFIAPKQKLSVQMHYHRAEHWVVVEGTAKVMLDGVERILTENQSIYIPIGAVHSLENPGKIPLNIIEVQSGSYLGEDDIVRFQDIYQRDTL